MRKSWLVLLAVVVAAGVAGCGNDDDGPYDFSGVWAYSERINAQSGGWSPFSGQVTVEQEGDFISLLFPGQPPAQGLCDPDNGTFSAQFYAQGGALVCSYRGQSEDADTMSGTAECSSYADGRWASLTWTAQLIGR